MPTKSSSNPQQRYLSLPSTLAVLVLFGTLILHGVSRTVITLEEYTLILVGFIGIAYFTLLFYFVLPSQPRAYKWRWGITLVNSIGLGFLSAFLSPSLYIIAYVLVILNSIITAITLGRVHAYILILVNVFAYLVAKPLLTTPLTYAINLSPYLVAIVLSETIMRLQDANWKHIKRLETLNKFARQISSSLEAKQVTGLLNSAIQGSFKADTYYAAFLIDKIFELSLLYDNGKYIQNAKLSLDGSLAGHVAKNQASMIIYDLPKEREKLNLQYTRVANERESVSWMGTPLQVGNTLFGVIAVASYRKDAFNSADLELLENLAQQASLALDNAYQHAEVTHQSHLDSLTSVYNHGYFLELLKREAENAQIRQKPLSLIMIDIDHFKEYNDRYGHLIGDKVLISLIASIRSHIKSMDIVGRWGGEEFCVLLFNADGDQAAMIARRIQETLVILTVNDRDGNPISVPTISQGIAIFPDETDDIYTLVDLADQRLYIAKERGRNQIEPGIKFGNYTQPLIK